MTSEREDIEILSEANVAFEKTNSTLEAKMKTELKQIAVLTSRMDKLEKTSAPAKDSSKLKHKKYCYTCGIQRDHWRRDFQVGIAGHTLDATWKDRKGGSNTDQTRA